MKAKMENRNQNPEENPEFWNNIKKMSTDGNIDVDRAWESVYSRIMVNPVEKKTRVLLPITWTKFAAAAVILLAIGTATFFAGRAILTGNQITISAGTGEKNVPVDLPDGSKIFLNRNSKLTYNTDFGTETRKVSLSGEAFFQIAPDKEKPFTIDAGKALVKVVGTSFNVKTVNSEAEVEVFVKTGKVLLSDKSGEKSVSLDPGYIGTMSGLKSGKKENNDPNYLAWNTGVLDYKGQKLSVVFNDLKKVYGMEIVADNPSILEYTWSSYIDNLPQDKIIVLICTSFNLNCTREGNIYHLRVK